MSILDGAYWEKEMHKKTNADKIRVMTDEELAEFLNINVLAEISGEWKNWLDWLKEEVSDETMPRL